MTPGRAGGGPGCGRWLPPPARSSSWPIIWSAEGIEKVTVESTSDYWRIWFYLLEAAGLDVQLVNARDVKNAPGRPKTDKLDAVWLAKLTERGMLRPSFVPPAEIRAAAGLHPAAHRPDPRARPGTGSGWRSCWKTR